MTLIPWSPFKDVSQWRDEMERFWQNAWAGTPFTHNFGPRVEVFQTDNEVVVRAEVPGIANKEELDITATQDTFILRGEFKRAQEIQESAYQRAERSYGTFARQIQLPAQVNPNDARASLQHGVLEVRAPKVEPSQSSVRINIQ